jgi:hypothetical protein
MAFQAGQKVTAAQLNRLQPAVYFTQTSSGTTFSTTTLTDVPGGSVTFTTQNANATYLAQANFSYKTVTAGTASPFTRGALLVDGVQASGESRWSEGATGSDSGDYDMAPKSWSGTLPAAGSHTLKLQCALSNVTGGAQVQCTGFTDLTVTIFEVV